MRFLQSVVPDALTGFGFAVTLTLRDLPSPEQWAALRKKWLRHVVERLGVVRVHWVTEWQRRGVPHLHGSVYFERELGLAAVHRLLLGSWVKLAAGFGARLIGQDVHPIDGAVGWWKYQAKHSARSVGHYQRGTMPVSWSSSGRMWGKAGDWPTREDALYLDHVATAQLRRLVRSYAVSEASKHLDPGRRRRGMRAARRMLSRPLAGVREWVPEAVLNRMLDWVLAQPGALALTPDEYAELMTWNLTQIHAFIVNGEVPQRLEADQLA